MLFFEIAPPLFPLYLIGCPQNHHNISLDLTKTYFALALSIIRFTLALSVSFCRVTSHLQRGAGEES